MFFLAVRFLFFIFAHLSFLRKYRIMKKLVFTLLLMLPLSVMAQKFGYMRYENLLKSMPEYTEVQNRIAELKEQYKAETERSETEFNRKYNEFLEGQKNFPQNILLKRQKELQDLCDNGIKFREECARLLKEAEEQLMMPVTSRLNTAIGEVGIELNLEYIINIEGKNYLFIGPNGVDITPTVKAKLGLPE